MRYFQVGPESILNKVLTSPETGLKIARSDLQLLLEPQHFRDGILIAKCVASMLTMHWQSTDVTIKEESPTLASVVDQSNGKNQTSEDSSSKAKKNSKVGNGFEISSSVTKMTSNVAGTQRPNFQILFKGYFLWSHFHLAAKS